MKLDDAAITILVSDERTTIEIKDKKASITFAKITLTPLELSQALSRLSYVHCEAEVFALDKINKTHQTEKFSFEIPKELRSSRATADLNKLAIKSLKESNMSEWMPDEYYASQDSFFSKDGKDYARVVIRRWV